MKSHRAVPYWIKACALCYILTSSQTQTPFISPISKLASASRTHRVLRLLHTLYHPSDCQLVYKCFRRRLEESSNIAGESMWRSACNQYCRRLGDLVFLYNNYAISRLTCFTSGLSERSSSWPEPGEQKMARSPSPTGQLGPQCTMQSKEDWTLGWNSVLKRIFVF